jgi:hypothetical protein
MTDTPRRVWLSVGAYLAAFGASHALCVAGVAPLVAYQVLAITSIVDTILWWGASRVGRAP